MTTNAKYRLPLDILNMPLITTGGYNETSTGTILDWHSHKSFEFTYVIEGNVTWESFEHTYFHLTPKYASYMKPNTTHRGRYGVTAPSKQFWIQLNPYAPNAKDNTTLTESYIDFMKKILESTNPQSFPVTDLITILLEEFSHLLKEEKLNLIKLRSILNLLIIETITTLKASQKIKEMPHYLKIIDYINMHYREDINITDISTYIEKGNTYIYNLLKEKTGLSLSHYINQVRINQSIILLEKTNKSITDIAFEVGYSSSQYFSKIFSKNLNCSPLQYRKKHFK